jgi:hypothetical protein
MRLAAGANSMIRSRWFPQAAESDRLLVRSLGEGERQELARRQGSGWHADDFVECGFVKLLGEYSWEE